MKISNKKLWDSQETINKLIKTKLPIKTTFKIREIVLKIEPILKLIKEEMDKITNECVIKDKDENDLKDYIKITPEGGQKLMELFNTEVNLDIEKLPLDIIPDTVELSVVDLEFLSFMLDLK